jgi:hypothetical protein
MYIAGEPHPQRRSAAPGYLFSAFKVSGPVDPAYSTQEHMAPGVFSQ